MSAAQLMKQLGIDLATLAKVHARAVIAERICVKLRDGERLTHAERRELNDIEHRVNNKIGGHR